MNLFRPAQMPPDNLPIRGRILQARKIAHNRMVAAFGKAKASEDHPARCRFRNTHLSAIVDLAYDTSDPVILEFLASQAEERAARYIALMDAPPRSIFSTEPSDEERPS